MSSIEKNISAAGSTCLDGTYIYSVYNEVTVCSSGQGVVFNNASQGQEFYVRNYSANALIVYPQYDGTINALSRNVGFSVAVGELYSFVNIDGENWQSFKW